MKILWLSTFSTRLLIVLIPKALTTTSVLNESCHQMSFRQINAHIFSTLAQILLYWVYSNSKYIIMFFDYAYYTTETQLLCCLCSQVTCHVAVSLTTIRSSQVQETQLGESQRSHTNEQAQMCFPELIWRLDSLPQCTVGHRDKSADHSFLRPHWRRHESVAVAWPPHFCVRSMWRLGQTVGHQGQHVPADLHGPRVRHQCHLCECVQCF